MGTEFNVSSGSYNGSPHACFILPGLVYHNFTLLKGMGCSVLFSGVLTQLDLIIWASRDEMDDNALDEPSVI